MEIKVNIDKTDMDLSSKLLSLLKVNKLNDINDFSISDLKN